MDPMWFYDEMGDQEEWQAFQKELLPLEKEYLAIRVALRDAEAALRDDPGNDRLQGQVEKLRERQAETERRSPWISSDYPWEFFLWGVPHG
jgi:SspJ family small acid-soluble spore protein